LGRGGVRAIGRDDFGKIYCNLVYVGHLFDLFERHYFYREEDVDWEVKKVLRKYYQSLAGMGVDTVLGEARTSIGDMGELVLVLPGGAEVKYYLLANNLLALEITRHTGIPVESDYDEHTFGLKFWWLRGDGYLSDFTYSDGDMTFRDSGKVVASLNFSRDVIRDNWTGDVWLNLGGFKFLELGWAVRFGFSGDAGLARKVLEIAESPDSVSTKEREDVFRRVAGSILAQFDDMFEGVKRAVVSAQVVLGKVR